jgi:hypothetical protein
VEEEPGVFNSNLQLSKAALGKVKFIRHWFSDNHGIQQEIQQEIQQIFGNAMNELKKTLPEEKVNWDAVPEMPI